MKQSLSLSVLIHLVLIGVMVMVTFLPPVEKKPEPIKITVMAPPPKNKPIETPLPTPKPESKPEPIKPIAPPKSMVTPPVTPVAAVPAEVPISAPVVPLSKPTETAVAKVSPPQENKPVEKKTIESASPDPSIKEAYLSYLRQTIDERKVYPKNAKRLRQSGTVIVKFTLLSNGTITNVSVAGSSGFELLDEATLDLLKALAKVRPLPKEIGTAPMELTLPIQYTLK
jgi:periplasmic protein TonB